MRRWARNTLGWTSRAQLPLSKKAGMPDQRHDLQRRKGGSMTTRIAEGEAQRKAADWA